MKRADLRQSLIKTKLNNRNVDGSYGDESFVTEDFVYLPNENDLSSFGSVDYILGMSGLVESETSQIGLLDTASGTKSASWLLRDGKGKINAFDEDGRLVTSDETYWKNFGIHPCFKYKLPSGVTNQVLLRMTEITKRNSINIEDSWWNKGKTKPYYVINVGEGPTKRVSDKTSLELEKLYSDESDSLKCTGRWFSVNGNYVFANGENVALKHLPEFEYKGKRYVRKSSSKTDLEGASQNFDVKWYEVTSIPYMIRNWDRLPKSINPYGTGEDKFFELMSEVSLFKNFPFHTNENAENNFLWQNSVPRAFLNGINTNNITENGNVKYGAQGGANCTGICNFIEESLNLTREPIVEYRINDGIEEIADTAFEGCRSLKKLIIPASVKKIGKDAFKGLKFKYMYKLNNGEIVFDTSMPLDKSNIEKVIDLENDINQMNSVLIGVKSKISLEMLASDDGTFEKMETLYKKMSRLKMPISYTYLKKLEKEGLLDDFLNNSVFKFFRNENSDISKKLLSMSDEEALDFYKFANVLGCFSKEKIKDSDGKETETCLAQKASSTLNELLKGKLPIGSYHGLFDSLSLDVKPNQKLLKFLFDKVDDNEKTKLDVILKLEKNGCPNLFVKILSNFKDVEKLRQDQDKTTGAQYFIPWEDTFKRFYSSHKYEGITNENADIAELYGKYGIGQIYFDQASELRKMAKAGGVVEHIAGREIKEETILESIERIKDDTQSELEDSKTLIEGMYKKLFTYEWLNKNDPQNGILGLMCSCCATLMSEHYGKYIAKHSIIAQDLQNLVVRNAEGDIIAKGAVYVNKEKGYAVVNDFEMSLKYREDEDMESTGRYLRTDTKAEERRQLIFDAFVRGIEDFVKAYEEEYPDRPPISQVNVGWGLNRLKNQVEKLERATKDLSVPLEYHFEDSTYKQYVLYKKDTTKQKLREDKEK